MAYPIQASRLFYATALLAWSVQNFILGNNVAGRPLLAAENSILAYAAGVVLAIAALSINFNVKPRFGAALAGFGILLWAGVPNIYMTISNLDYGYMLTSMNKALTFGFGGLLVAHSYPDESKGLPQFNKVVDTLGPLSIFVTGFFLLASGIQHFLFAGFVKNLIPTWIPGSLFFTYFSGVALLAAGIGMITGIQRKLACELAALMVFIWVFALHLPRAIGEGNANEWTAVFEALAVSGLLVLSASLISKRITKLVNA
jgi:uncharacterized membrane protein